MDSRVDQRTDRFPLYVWVVLAFTVIVIVSGDVVQATESGAGCGETWPRCDGSLIPSISDFQTGVEFTHRALTFVLSLGYLGLVVGAWRRRGWDDGGGMRSFFRNFTPGGFRNAYRQSNQLWRVTTWAVLFFVVEVIIGAMLVVFGWVESDASIGRVIADGFHVVNTFAMVATLTLAGYLASGDRHLRFDRGRLSHRVLMAGAGVITLIGITGAINSLADTLYFADDVVVDETPIAAILVSIRAIHPIVAIVGGLAVYFIARYLAEGQDPAVGTLALIIQGIVWVQFVVGMLNIALLTPLESQVVHLVAAHSLWIAFMLLGTRLLEAPAKVAG